MLRTVLLLSVLALASCARSDPSGASSNTISSLGGLMPDPASTVAYATDATLGTVHTLNLRTGLIDHSRSYQTTTGAVAPDPDGRRLVVALPTDQRLSLLRLPELSSLSVIPLDAPPLAVTWLDGDRVAVVAGKSLLEVDVRSGIARSLGAEVQSRSKILYDRTRERLFVADQDDETSRLRVRCFALSRDDANTPPSCTESDRLDGECLALHLGWDGQSILVASNAEAGTYFLDTESLTLQDTMSLAALDPRNGPANLVAASFNATGTRIYLAHDNATIRELELDRFHSRLESFPLARVSDLGMVMPSDGLNLITHLENEELQIQRPFELQLIADPTAELGRGWDLEVHGTPGTRVRIFVSTDPGSLHLSPRDSEPLMLDIDLAQTRFLSGVELASNGAALARFAVPKNELLVDRRFILQAVGWSPLTGGILHTSNPLVVSTRALTIER